MNNITDIPNSELRKVYCILDGESQIYAGVLFKTKEEAAKLLDRIINLPSSPSGKHIPPFRLCKLSVLDN